MKKRSLVKKKQRRRNSDVVYLPEEIIRNILKRLPVKSLIRFQRVCKLWKNVIQNPSFIADHLQQSRHQNPSLLLEANGLNIPLSLRLHLLDCRLQVRDVQKAPLMDSLEGANIVGSCNGLLCLEISEFHQSSHSLSLWNPATTAVRHVPSTGTDVLFFDNWVTGFGFSPIVNDYKIVRAYAEFDDGVDRVEVFSLSRGTWKVIDIGNLKGVKICFDTVTTNGTIFWSGIKLGAAEGDVEDEFEDGEDLFEVIVSFDIAKEVFTVIPKPELDFKKDEKLTVYENKLARICHIWDNDGGTPDLVELWVLDEGTCASGETWSLIKRCTSSPQSSMLDLMTIWGDEIIYKPIFDENNEEGSRTVLCFMNTTANEVQNIAVPCCGPFLNIYNYVESLVSVGDNYIEES